MLKNNTMFAIQNITIMAIKITPETLEVIKQDKELKLKIQAALIVTTITLNTILNNNDARLTQLDSLNVITEHLNKPLSEIVDTRVSKLLCK